MNKITLRLKINELDMDIVNMYDPNLNVFWGTVHIDLFTKYELPREERHNILYRLQSGEEVEVEIIEFFGT